MNRMPLQKVGSPERRELYYKYHIDKFSLFAALLKSEDEGDNDSLFSEEGMSILKIEIKS